MRDYALPLLVASGAGAWLMLWFVVHLELSQKAFVREHIDKPWCVETSIGDRTYRRCWKAVEVEP